MGELTNFYPVILAGGSGTRFWPRSRRKQAKQVLALDGEQTMIQQTFNRLLPLTSSENFWVITNEYLLEAIQKQLKRIPKRQVISEPVARNTAPAIGLAAFILQRQNPNAIIGLFPADHVIGNEKRFHEVLQNAIQLASHGGNIVVMGVTPSRPETGYGYIEVGEAAGENVRRVRRFTEKPNAERAEEFVNSGRYFWNSGIFLWRAATLAHALEEHLSETAPFLRKIAEAYGQPNFSEVFADLYPKCENISVDYAVLEPRSSKGEHSSHLYCLPAEFGWNDLGSWSALYEHHLAAKGSPNGKNVVETTDHYSLNAEGNYVYAPEKFVAMIGVRDLVVVETDDALLVTTRQHAQDVGKVVKHLTEKKLTKLT